MTITVKDVAKKAGVATSTVSRVINDHPSISIATKEKVRNIMKDMGYVPNISARNLGTQSANALGIILPPFLTKEQVGNPFYLELIYSINQAAVDLQLATVIITGKDNEELLNHVKQMYAQKQVDGFILTYSIKNDPILHYLMKETIPVTLIGKPCSQRDGLSYVDNDNQLLGRCSTNHLIEHHHQKILFLTDRQEDQVFIDRYIGYQSALKQANLPVFSPKILQEKQDWQEFIPWIQREGITGAIVMDEGLALKTIQALSQIGYEIPADFSLISFNNSFLATLTHPFLTSVDIQIHDLATASVKQLVSQLTTPTTRQQPVIIQTYGLIQRETVGQINTKD
ncbi:LacI family DNA-binding transcriptional regulator [Vagococcus humatus]|uniref:LacI family transcriptional regulator n=1 Tax=Vagococcus humatus TaxID=1889241 RepID=A0A3S0ABS9_9ENTE|nr:LacI family DNA-binding transcriptional regulator [Vagococcus humatus]RST89194.1 LacI family transcriptional regulator [Vagococcus humatus]